MKVCFVYKEYNSLHRPLVLSVFQPPFNTYYCFVTARPVILSGVVHLHRSGSLTQFNSLSYFCNLMGFYMIFIITMYSST